MKLKLFVASILIAAQLFAQNGNSIDKTKELGDDGKPLKVKERDGYMPNITTPEYAKSGIYGGLGLGANSFNAKTASLSHNINMLTFSLLAGYNINEYLATESRASISIANDNSINYDNVAIYIKPQYDIYNGLTLYSLLGFGKMAASSSISNATSASKTSMQLGFGANYTLPNNFKVFADYTFIGKDGKAKYQNNPATIKSAAFTSGITYDF